MPETEQGQALPVTLKIFAVLSLIGGIIQTCLTWPRGGGYGILAGTQYTIPIVSLAAGILFCCTLWALAEVLVHVRYLSEAQCDRAPSGCGQASGNNHRAGAEPRRGPVEM